MLMTFTKTIKSAELAEDKMKRVNANGKVLMLVKLHGKIYCNDDVCTHVGGPLSQGKLDGKEVICPWHASRFDVTTGKCKGGPAVKDLNSYKVRDKDGFIEVDL